MVTVEGSANLTSHPRLEQHIVTNDRGLYDFHRTWMEEILQAPSKAAAAEYLTGQGGKSKSRAG